ncbi:hypothetical protein [Nocardia paucivorans]|uniref:hypothetical protein n=1 Tax=Nocardia paucivorans TaxID=114259 RepID=UPI0002FA2641|nr:hypothetical protein [Nocardia paucivorans]
MTNTKPTRYLSLRGVAAVIDPTYPEVKRLHKLGRLPNPDIEIGGLPDRDDENGADRVRPAYLPSTIADWWKRYVPMQRGTRTDLRPIEPPPTPPTPPRYLTLKGVADLTGYSYNTVKGYWRDGRLPDPDIEVGGPLELDGTDDAVPVTPVYRIETIETWMREGRPGRGARTDLHPHPGGRRRSTETTAS